MDDVLELLKDVIETMIYLENNDYNNKLIPQYSKLINTILINFNIDPDIRWNMEKELRKK